MIDFNKIFGEIPVNQREIMYEEEQWCIYQRYCTDTQPDHQPCVIETNILHACNSENGYVNHRDLHRLHTSGIVSIEQLRNGDSRCDRCRKPTPEYIQGLYLMLQWDEKI